MNKKSKTFYLNGSPINLADECRKRGLEYHAIHERIKRGWSTERALSTPINKCGKFKYGNKTGTLKELCEIFGWDYSFISNQIYLKRNSLLTAVNAVNFKGKKKKSKKSKRSKRSKKPTELLVLTKRHEQLKKKYIRKATKTWNTYRSTLKMLELTVGKEILELEKEIAQFKKIRKNSLKPILTAETYNEFQERVSLVMKNAELSWAMGISDYSDINFEK